MSKNKIVDSLSDILPDRPTRTIGSAITNADLVDDEARRIEARQDAAEIARIKYREKQKLRKLKAKAAEQFDNEDIGAIATNKEAQEQQKRVEVIEAIEADIVEPFDPNKIAGRASMTSSNKATHIPSLSDKLAVASQLQGTTRPEIAKLLTSLNINLNVQLSKQDTANLLACILTCNESQLNALMKNSRVPVVIKTLIKRLLEDMKLGNIDTVERVWDRIFGKGAMQLNLPEQAQTQTGIIPNTPISREAYIVIRDTLMR